MITSVPRVTNKVKLKIAKRIINTVREENVQSVGLSRFCTVLRSTGSCQGRECLHGFHLREAHRTSVLMLF